MPHGARGTWTAMNELSKLIQNKKLSLGPIRKALTQVASSMSQEVQIHELLFVIRKEKWAVDGQGSHDKTDTARTPA